MPERAYGLQSAPGDLRREVLQILRPARQLQRLSLDGSTNADLDREMPPRDGEPGPFLDCASHALCHHVPWWRTDGQTKGLESGGDPFEKRRLSTGAATEDHGHRSAQL